MTRRHPQHFNGHLERYVFAGGYCVYKKVLDVGSKDGYGSHLLSRYASRVSLVDRNIVWMAEAKRYYRYLCPVEFFLLDLETEFPEGEWDTIVAFEVIEHVENYKVLLQNIQKHLKPEGKFIFSVPHMVENPDHKVLFDEEKIKKDIEEYFTLEEFYTQDKCVISGRPATSPPVSYVGVAIKK